ncbi:hypothetical protein BDP81DRAFT_417809 [Colletotrichum phormii]|uniref:Uncharacterized protein n=1 Tax=Colletotrichum phormii TaxID=359342 RepID=A0AAI9ZZ99_9PEZI|nr:uncharacterized protein BDP81DRAFT_417809 [Colletotrichum phormii]KAK1640984.1 hypothetical protein BDP81DRAFT_417809 [Colletotrichum phormii]
MQNKFDVEIRQTHTHTHTESRNGDLHVHVPSIISGATSCKTRSHLNAVAPHGETRNPPKVLPVI